MKFFSEFGSCFGGTIVTPAADYATTAAPRSAGNKSHSSSRSGGKVSSSAHWKPVLSAISEDSVTSEIGIRRRKDERAVRSQKKASEKARSTARSPTPSHADNYSKDSSMVMALPAFSPTAFLF